MAAPCRAPALLHNFIRINLHQRMNLSTWHNFKVKNIGTQLVNSIRHGDKRKQLWKKLSFLTVLTTGGVYFAIKTANESSNKSILSCVTVTAKGKPDIKPSRTVSTATDNSGLKLTLFQYQTCPFCSKVRAMLDYHGFSYDVVEVNSVWRTEVKWSKYRKVPILVCDGIGKEGFLQINDSSIIMSLLQTYLVDRTVSLDKILSFYPALESKVKGKTVYEYPNKHYVMYQSNKVHTTVDQRKEERDWRVWSDDILVHTLSPNVYRNPTEALQAFNYFSKVGHWEDTFSAFERISVIYIGAAAMFFIGKLLKRRYKLKPDVRESLYDACREWTVAVGPSRQFMGGDQPCLADLTVFGYLSSIEGCDAFQDLLANTDIGPWFDRTKESVGNHHGSHPHNRI